MRLNRYCKGLTLIELLITLTISAIVVGYTGIHWGGWVNQSRHRTLVLSYRQMFNFAREMAVNHQYIVTICPLSISQVCVDDWSKPASIFPDSNNDKKPDNGEIWRVVSAPPSSYRVVSRTAGRGYFQFKGSGMVYGASGSLVLCPTQHNSDGRMSYLTVNRGGRFRSVHGQNGSRKIRLRWGATIECP